MFTVINECSHLSIETAGCVEGTANYANENQKLCALTLVQQK